MSAPTREQVIAWVKEAGGIAYLYADTLVISGKDLDDEAMMIAWRAYLAGRVDERSEMPPAPLVVDASHIDKDALAAAMKRARPVMVAAAPATRREHIDALVGDRLTADKAGHICERDGYTVTGVVLTLPDGRACIVNRSAVRWLSGETDLWNLMHTDSGLNQRLIAEAVAAEREACAKVCDAVAAKRWPNDIGPEADECAAAIRARGES